MQVDGMLAGEHLEACAAGLVKELVREVAEDSYHEAALAARAHKSEQVCVHVCACVCVVYSVQYLVCMHAQPCQCV